MESTASSRQLTDLGSDRARPGLALVLALLSVPGSTISWYFIPLGGLLIGLPLGIAAIVLGRKAREQLGGASGSGMALAAIVIATIAIAQMANYYAVEALA